jgi:hypothetical protein
MGLWTAAPSGRAAACMHVRSTVVSLHGILRQLLRLDGMAIAEQGPKILGAKTMCGALVLLLHCNCKRSEVNQKQNKKKIGVKFFKRHVNFSKQKKEGNEAR